MMSLATGFRDIRQMDMDYSLHFSLYLSTILFILALLV